MYPNYSKAFLDLEDVFVKKIIQANSFLKVFIETRPSEQIYPCCGWKTESVHDYRTQEIDGLPFQGKSVTLTLRKRRYLCTSCGKWFFKHYSFLPSYHRRTKRLTFYVISLLRRLSLSSRFHSLLVFLFPPSASFWIPFIMTRRINCLKLSPLMNLRGMPLLESINVSFLIQRNTGFWIFFQTAFRAIWLITGETTSEMNGWKQSFLYATSCFPMWNWPKLSSPMQKSL